MRRIPLRFALLSAAALSLCSTLARADWPSGGVLATGPARTGNPTSAIVADGKGGLGVLDNRPLRGFVMQRLDALTGAVEPGWAADGIAWAGESANLPAGSLGVTPDGAGGFFHAWYTNQGNVPASSFSIALERILADGTHQPATVPAVWKLATVGSVTIIAPPGIARDDSAGAFVAWATPTSLQLLRARGTGTIVPGWPAAGVALGAVDYPLFLPPVLDRDGASGVVVMYQSFDSMQVVRYRANGTLAPGWTASGLRLNRGSALPATLTWAKLVGSDSTHWLATWLEPTDGVNPAMLKLARFKNDGTLDPAWPAGGVIVRSAAAIAEPSVAKDGAGGAWLTWEESGVARVRRVLASGSFAPAFVAGPLDPLDPGAVYGVSGTLQCTSGRGNAVVIAWDDTRASQPGVRVRGLLGDGSPDPQWPDSGRVVPTPSAGSALRALTTDGDGGAYVSYIQANGAANELWATHLALTPNALGVTPHAPATLALAAGPNPARGALALAFALPTNAPARVQLLDVAGRVVRSREVAGAGAHTLRFDDLGSLAPGVYLARVAQGALSRTTRVAIVR